MTALSKCDEVRCGLSKEFSGLDLSCIPKHIAIIMDGNRRWACDKGINIYEGHWAGAANLVRFTEMALELGIRYCTVYAFSTENWCRSEQEIDGLMEIFSRYLQEQKAHMVKKGVRLHGIGDLNQLSPSVRRLFKDVMTTTQHCQQLNLVIAVNYGSRNEIVRATKAIAKDFQEGKLDIDSLDESTFTTYLDTGNFPDPELLIRTSGESRISNFLLWQLSYAEFYFTDVYWPDFNAKELCKSLLIFQRRRRRFGGS